MHFLEPPMSLFEVALPSIYIPNFFFKPGMVVKTPYLNTRQPVLMLQASHSAHVCSAEFSFATKKIKATSSGMEFHWKVHRSYTLTDEHGAAWKVENQFCNHFSKMSRIS